MANTFKLKTKANVGVTTVGIYTAPASTTTVVIGITLANTSGVWCECRSWNHSCRRN